MSSRSSPVWIAAETVLAVHEALLAEHGGGTGLRDSGLLDSALARPINAGLYGDPPPSVPELAALYAIAISQNHPFVDGNKRVAYVLLETFLELNGFTLPVLDAEAIAMMWSLAAGEESDATFTRWVCEKAVAR